MKYSNSKIALIQSVTDGVSRRVKVKLHQFDIRRSRSQGHGAYYRDALLSQQLLPAICQVSDEFLIVQQDKGRARRSINLLERETPAFISTDSWSPNSPDLNPVDYKV